MQTDKIVRGDEIMLFDENRKSLAFSTSHSLALQADVTEVATKDSAEWKDARVNKLGWEITSENLYCTVEFDKLFDKWTAREAVTVYFALAKPAPGGIDSPDASHEIALGNMYTGKAVITALNVNAPSGDNATYSITLKGTGKFVKAVMTELIPDAVKTPADKK